MRLLTKQWILLGWTWEAEHFALQNRTKNLQQYLLGCCWLQLGRYGFGLDCLGLMEGLKLTMKKYCILKDSAAGGTAVMVEVEEVMDG